MGGKASTHVANGSDKEIHVRAHVAKEIFSGYNGQPAKPIDASEFTSIAPGAHAQIYPKGGGASWNPLVAGLSCVTVWYRDDENKAKVSTSKCFMEKYRNVILDKEGNLMLAKEGEKWIDPEGVNYAS